ncbi:MAG: hypothetical protein KF799_15665 [Bdellovibrionales bacterium]|nr:hypothetical protein [Bdellovibrionales bacterium]
MNTENIFANLISTPHGALYMGVCLSVGVLSSALAIGYYTIFRYPSLIYFAISVLVSYAVFGSAATNPRMLIELSHPPADFYFQQISATVGFFFFFKMVTESFVPFPKGLSLRAFQIVISVLIAVRVYATFAPHPWAFRAASVLCITFLLYASVVALRYPATTSAMRLVRVACAFPSLLFVLYPMIRLGILPASWGNSQMAALMVGGLTLHSILWFLGLVELAREAREKEKAASRDRMARTLVQLGDMMGNPLDTIEDTVAKLGNNKEELVHVLEKMDSSVSRLRLIEAVLSRYEKNTRTVSDEGA